MPLAQFLNVVALFADPLPAPQLLLLLHPLGSCRHPNIDLKTSPRFQDGEDFLLPLFPLSLLFYI